MDSHKIMAFEYVERERNRILEELCELLAIKTVSAPSAHNPEEIIRGAHWLKSHLQHIGLDNVQLIDTGRNPVAYGEWMKAPGKPVVLCYGHYDVQPAEDHQFRPEVLNGSLYARGASDNKGQFFTHLKAIEALLRTGGLNCNLRVLLEGGEEDAVMGDLTLQTVRQRPDLIEADCVLISDTEMFRPRLPTVIIGLRGIAAAEIVLYGVRSETGQIHSGIHGGAAPNPLQAAGEIIAKCKDTEGRILIPNFYDDVEAPDAMELHSWGQLGFSEEEYCQELGVEALAGEMQFGALHRRWARPTFEVHGVVGGHMADGISTIIPSHVTVKLTMRLVPRQRPTAVLEALARHIAAIAPPWIRAEVRPLPSEPAVIIAPENKYIRCAIDALSATFPGEMPVLIRDGGSIPIVSFFNNERETPCVLMGWGLPDDGIHTANEKLSLTNFFGGIDCVIRFLRQI